MLGITPRPGVHHSKHCNKLKYFPVVNTYELCLILKCNKSDTNQWDVLLN